MLIEVIPTKTGKVVLILKRLYPESTGINPVDWNDAIHDAEKFLDDNLIDTNKQFKRGDQL